MSITEIKLSVQNLCTLRTSWALGGATLLDLLIRKPVLIPESDFLLGKLHSKYIGSLTPGVLHISARKCEKCSRQQASYTVVDGVQERCFNCASLRQDIFTSTHGKGLEPEIKALSSVHHHSELKDSVFNTIACFFILVLIYYQQLKNYAFTNSVPNGASMAEAAYINGHTDLWIKINSYGLRFNAYELITV